MVKDVTLSKVNVCVSCFSDSHSIWFMFPLQLGEAFGFVLLNVHMSITDHILLYNMLSFSNLTPESLIKCFIFVMHAWQRHLHS